MGVDVDRFVLGGGGFPEYLRCPVCLEAAWEPTLACAAQEHILCGDCWLDLTAATPQNPRCPTCRAPLRRPAKVSLATKRALDSLKIRCKDSRCSWTGSLSDEEQHRTRQCDFRRVLCGDCGAEHAHADRDAHTLCCPSKFVECPRGGPDCGWKTGSGLFMRKDWNEHEAECTSWPCTVTLACSTRTTRFHLPAHEAQCADVQRRFAVVEAQLANKKNSLSTRDAELARAKAEKIKLEAALAKAKQADKRVEQVEPKVKAPQLRLAAPRHLLYAPRKEASPTEEADVGRSLGNRRLFDRKPPPHPFDYLPAFSGTSSSGFPDQPYKSPGPSTMAPYTSSSAARPSQPTSSPSAVRLPQSSVPARSQGWRDGAAQPSFGSGQKLTIRTPVTVHDAPGLSPVGRVPRGSEPPSSSARSPSRRFSPFDPDAPVPTSGRRTTARTKRSGPISLDLTGEDSSGEEIDLPPSDSIVGRMRLPTISPPRVRSTPQSSTSQPAADPSSASPSSTPMGSKRAAETDSEVEILPSQQQQQQQANKRRKDD
ncbi:hypothetical protein JCM10213_000273 [Rhodosporidiobolus nylandii]